MDRKVREQLKILVNNEELIPRRFWRETLWLQEDESLGIERSGKIHWQDKRGKHVGSWKRFFVKKRGPYNESWITNATKDYLLFLKKEKLSARDILRCSNVEIRRALLSEYGFKKFVEELGGTIIQRDGESELILLRFGIL